jgi:uncharacterized protein (UPF0147 family)
MRVKAPLDDFLAATAAVIRRRELTSAGLWALVAGGAGVLVAAAAVGVTLRGDRIAPIVLGAWGLAAASLLLRALRRARRLGGTRHRTALTIAQNRGPLTPRSTREDPAGALEAADLALRWEILGAAELDQALNPRPGDAVVPGPGSRELAGAYVHAVAARLRACDPGLAAPPLRLRAPALALAALGLGGALLSSRDDFVHGLALLFSAEDGTPPVPPEPLWSNLELTLVAPGHAARPARTVRNPSGKLRVLAGTRIDLELTPRRPFTALHLIVAHDALAAGTTPPPERNDLGVEPDGTWRGSFVVRGSGSWHLVADEEPGPAFGLELEPDDPPEVELAPLPRSQGELSERDAVELRFKARDDFGLAQATLVFEGADKQEIRLDAGAPPPGARSWQHRYTWDLSSVPIGDRNELTYWIEVRDNDPGLGLEPLADPPGKPARSARMRLSIRDEEREHAENLTSLAALRDASVDLLARRMIREDPALAAAKAAVPETMSEQPAATPPPSAAVARADIPDSDFPYSDFPDSDFAADDFAADDIPDSNFRSTVPTAGRAGKKVEAVPQRPAAELDALRSARDLLSTSEQLLAALREAIDALSVDTLISPRDVATLTAIHRRLLDLHRVEAALHVELPPDLGARRPIAALLKRLAAHNHRQVTQLEDEIIRLDDLVDDQVVAQIEQLVARLQASQQKLVDLLEKLKAGDESVRGEIDQLQQRIREDLRRLSEARARLDKEVGQEFLNLDAFQALEARMRNQDVGEQLRRGDVDGALDQARDALDELRNLRDDVQQRLADTGRDDVPLSPQERARMETMRELSRLQDDEVGLRSDTRALHQHWRSQAERQPLDPTIAKKVAQKAAALRKDLEAINDARLGRDARRALEDAREQLQQLEGESAADSARALQAFEAAQRAAQALQRAAAGAGENSAERRNLERAGSQAQRVQDQLGGELPAPEAGLKSEQLAKFQAAQERQAGLRGRAQQLLEGSSGEALGEPGKQALRAALEGMQGSDSALGQRRGGPALDAQNDVIGALQRALDSMRQSSPPGAAASQQPSSTETERDRSLRDELMDAMKEGAPAGFDQEVERYYEELLR